MKFNRINDKNLTYNFFLCAFLFLSGMCALGQTSTLSHAKVFKKPVTTQPPERIPGTKNDAAENNRSTPGKVEVKETNFKYDKQGFVVIAPPANAPKNVAPPVMTKEDSLNIEEKKANYLKNHPVKNTSDK
ncbi:MAG TPA: hypothetical protein VNY73_04480 [Bacteroidia bacterium]|jgi:hypothetical protein|nr:hypothetical protein [Bacteroidia bacterium]